MYDVFEKNCLNIILMYSNAVSATSEVDLCAPENKESLAYLTLRACPKPDDMPFGTDMERCL